MLNRRQLVGGLVSLAVVGVRSRPVSGAAPRPARGSLEGKLSKAVFVALLGETLAVSTSQGTLWVQLVQLDDGAASPVTEQFTLVFRGPRAPVLSEASYPIRHRIAGRTEMFLQLSQQDASHSYYEAPFNLLL
jgi:hypothetical protein